jgi:phage terminase small subunit
MAPAAKLTPMAWRFVEQMIMTADPESAARAAGYHSPAINGPALLKKPEIRAAIAQARSFRSTRTAVYQDYVLRSWVQLASVEGNDFVELRIVACRYCHGEEHRYQRTQNEYRNDVEAHRQKQRKDHPDHPERRELFDERGGDGYRFDLVPAPDCPECAGDGVPRPVFKDSRAYSPAARRAYQGVKVLPGGGFELKLRNPEFAETMIAKHLGMTNDREPVREFDPSRMTVAELEAVVENLPPLIREQVEAMFEHAVDDPRITDAEAEVISEVIDK